MLPDFKKNISKIKPKPMAENILKHLYSGLWTFYFFIVILSVLIILLKFDMILFIAEHFQIDSYDYILSIQWYKEYGPTGNIPFFSDEYTLYGNWPLLYAFLGSLIDHVLNDASLSMTVLYWIIEIIMAFLLYTKFLKTLDTKTKLLITLFFLVSVCFGTYFPLGFRRRQQLAILFGMLMFLTDKILPQLVLTFLAFMAQPFVAVGLVALKAGEFLDKKKIKYIILFAISILLTYPFYSHLFELKDLEPSFSGCGYINQKAYVQFVFLLLLAAILFYLHNIKEFGFFELASLALFASYPVVLILFIFVSSIAPLWFMDPFFNFFSIPCYDNLFNVAALGMVVTVYLKKVRVPETTKAIILLLAILSLVFLSSIISNEMILKDNLEEFFLILEQNNLHNIKTFEILVTEYSGVVHFKPVWPMFGHQGYSLLYNKNVTFVEQYNMPPQLSKGSSNIYLADFPSAIFEEDFDRCKLDVQKMKEANIDGFIILYDASSSSVDYNIFSDEETLNKCGIRAVDISKAKDAHVVIYAIN